MIKITKDKFDILSHHFDGNKMSAKKISDILGIPRSEAEVYRALISNQEQLKSIFSDQDDLVTANIMLAKKTQLLQCTNRIERNTVRKHFKMENALTALNEAVISEFDKIKWNKGRHIEPVTFVKGDQAIIQLTDTHFNELVDLEHNTYDFNIAGKRMALFASEAKRILGSYGIKKVILAMTGDMINSDRRLDEKLNMATNRMTASMIAVDLIRYFIDDLMTEFNQMDVVYVTGNESRAFEFGFTDMVVTDNYDSVIFNMLKLVYKDSRVVNFIDSNPVETVINVNGRNILLFHGTTIGGATQQNVQKFIGKYAGKGVAIDYALFGHIHFCNIGDIFARSGSLVGANTYSDFGLGLITKASQNLHIIRENGSISNYRVELQNVDDVQGYPIQTELDAYNAKSASKTHRQYKVIEIEQSRT